jgi:hypothetical protein
MYMAAQVRRSVERPRTCTHADGRLKVCYPTFRFARTVAHAQRGERLRPYTCPNCGAVHLGHKAGAV